MNFHSILISTQSIESDPSLDVTATLPKRTVDDGAKMTVSCTTNHNWKTCTWLYHGKSCQIEYAYNKTYGGNGWRYDEILCDSNFGKYTFIEPEGYHLGNKNKICKIKLESVTYEGEYVCTFQRCNQEENDFCKTKVSADRKSFSASINVKVKLLN